MGYILYMILASIFACLYYWMWLNSKHDPFYSGSGGVISVVVGIAFPVTIFFVFPLFIVRIIHEHKSRK